MKIQPHVSSKFVLAVAASSCHFTSLTFPVFISVTLLVVSSDGGRMSGVAISSASDSLAIRKVETLLGDDRTTNADRAGPALKADPAETRRQIRARAKGIFIADIGGWATENGKDFVVRS